MHLAQGEVVKPQAQLGRDIWFRVLLTGQVDVKPDGLGADIEGAAVRSLHNARAAASDNHQLGRKVVVVGMPPNQPSEFARDLIIPALAEDSFGHRKIASDSSSGAA
jgi:hypothetical protein